MLRGHGHVLWQVETDREVAERRHIEIDGVAHERTGGDADPGRGTWDIWTTDLAGNVDTRLTSDPDSEAFPVWMPDGRTILFAEGRRRGGTLDLIRKRLDTAAEEPLLPPGQWQRRPIDVSPDGQTLLFTERTARGTARLLTLPLAGAGRRSLGRPCDTGGALRGAAGTGGSSRSRRRAAVFTWKVEGCYDATWNRTSGAGPASQRS